MTRSEALRTYACPACGGSLDSVRQPDGSEVLVCGAAACGLRAPVRDGVVRFVGDEHYARGFGFQWNRFAKTQLDSRTGLGLSARRFWAESRWPRDLRGELILEAGSGAGRFTEVLAQTGARVFSFDATGAVDANRDANGAKANVELSQADLFHMPFRKDTFDRVVCLGVLQHTPSAERALAELVRVLKPGGHLVADHYVLNGLTPFRGKYWLRPFTRGRDAATLFPRVERYFHFWYDVVGRATPLLGPAAPHVADMLGICDYRREIPEADAALVREMSLLDTFDMLAPAYDRPRRPRTVRRWLGRLGMVDVDVAPGYNGIEIRARKRAPGAP